MTGEMETCEQCCGTGCDNHPDSGQTCFKCNGNGATVEACKADIDRHIEDIDDE